MPSDFELQANGWSAVPRSFKKSLIDLDQEGATLSVKEVTLPASELARKTFEYSRAGLPERTFNHSIACVSYTMVGEKYFLE